jgi:hypothetical protein
MTPFKDLKEAVDSANIALDKICEAIRALPDNEKVTRINDTCFTIKASDLGKSWGAAHHDFKESYNEVCIALKKTDISNVYNKLTEIINSGKIEKKGHTIVLHENVIKNLSLIINPKN